MTVHYSGSEIIDIAKQIEACGEAFYDAAVQNLKAENLRKVFVYLRDEETKHAAIFEDLLKRLEYSAGEWRQNEEYLAYMRALAENRVFPDPDAARASVANLADEAAAVHFAIGFEKDSILFFHGLRFLISEQDQAVVDRLIAEEQKHVLTLTRLLSEIRGEA